MSPALEEARAKVNLTLHVKGRRVDGYHELSSIVAFADLGDRLTIAPAKENTLTVTGPFAHDVPIDGNIIWKAWRHLSTLMDVPHVAVQIEKNLPVAAGIGGGSANAGAMLRGLLKLVKRELDMAQIQGLATIGADVPVCFRGEACLMEGIGEKISGLTNKLPPAIVLVNPGVPCGTAQVFSAIGLKPGQAHQGGMDEWRNDMTEAAISVQPVIAEVLGALKKTDLSPALMTGSGATCFGLASSLGHAEGEARKLAQDHPQWWVKAARLI
jgi:4-diphosphocytidyl-2-C-methyl-D-erythritol kinase